MTTMPIRYIAFLVFLLTATGLLRGQTQQPEWPAAASQPAVAAETVKETPNKVALYFLGSLFCLGVFFCANGYHLWYVKWQNDDELAMTARIAMSLGMSLIFPITIIYYCSRLAAAIMVYVTTPTPEEKKKPPEKIRCHFCSQPISIQDSFCSLCGADQTESKQR